MPLEEEVLYRIGHHEDVRLGLLDPFIGPLVRLECDGVDLYAGTGLVSCVDKLKCVYVDMFRPRADDEAVQSDVLVPGVFFRRLLNALDALCGDIPSEYERSALLVYLV